MLVYKNTDRQKNSRLFSCLAPCLVAALVLAGCGGSDNDTSNDASVNISSATGTDMSVFENAQVVLSTSIASEQNANSLQYSWKQVSGSAVELLDASSATPNFIAPAVDADTVLSFEVTMNNSTTSKSDTVDITVLDYPYPLEAKRQEVMAKQPTVNAEDGMVNVDFIYNVAPMSSLTNGLVFALYWDSTKLDFEQIKEVMAVNHIGVSKAKSDQDNADLNTQTDQYVVLSWVDVDAAAWPNNVVLPAKLFTASFKTKQTSGSTQLTIKSNFSDSDYLLYSKTVSINL